MKSTENAFIAFVSIATDNPPSIEIQMMKDHFRHLPQKEIAALLQI
jgi:hypothetical protein